MTENPLLIPLLTDKGIAICLHGWLTKFRSATLFMNVPIFAAQVLDVAEMKVILDVIPTYSKITSCISTSLFRTPLC